METASAVDAPAELWIFGYGSLVWKNEDVPRTQSEECFIEGYARRFWQGSTDHRGTPAAPGRVVSLYSPADMKQMGVSELDDREMGTAESKWRVYGRAFKVTDERREQVIRHLDDREMDGYIQVWLPLFQHNGIGPTILVERALTYVAKPSNQRFLGFAPHSEIASHVLAAAGPSGTNVEYVENLARALRDMGAADRHLDGILQFCRQTVHLTPPQNPDRE